MDKRNILDPRARLMAWLDAINDAELIEHLAPEDLLEVSDELVDARIEQLGLTDAVDRLEARARELTQPQLRRTVTVSPVDKLYDALDDEAETILAMSDEEVDQELAALMADRKTVIPIKRAKERKHRSAGGRLWVFESWYSRAAGVLVAFIAMFSLSSQPAMLASSAYDHASGYVLALMQGDEPDVSPLTPVEDGPAVVDDQPDIMVASNDGVSDSGQAACGAQEIYDENAAACTPQVTHDAVAVVAPEEIVIAPVLPDAVVDTSPQIAHAPEVPVNSVVGESEPVLDEDAVDPIEEPVLDPLMIAAVDTDLLFRSANLDDVGVAGIRFSMGDFSASEPVMNLIDSPAFVFHSHVTGRVNRNSDLSSQYTFEGANADMIRLGLSSPEYIPGALYSPSVTGNIQLGDYSFKVNLNYIDTDESFEDIQLSLLSDAKTVDFGYQVDWTSLDAERAAAGEWQMVKTNLVDGYDDITVEFSWSHPLLECGAEESTYTSEWNAVRATGSSEVEPESPVTFAVAYLDVPDLKLRVAMENLSAGQGILLPKNSNDYKFVTVGSRNLEDDYPTRLGVMKNNLSEVSNVLVWSHLEDMQDVPEMFPTDQWTMVLRYTF